MVVTALIIIHFAPLRCLRSLREVLFTKIIDGMLSVLKNSIILQCLEIVHVLHFDDVTLLACSHVVCKLLEMKDFLAEFAFGNGIIALNSVVPDLFALCDFGTASLTHYFHVLTFIKFMRTKYQFFVC